MYLKKTAIDTTPVNNNSLIALALLVAESPPSQKTLMIQLITTLLKEESIECA